MTIELILLGVLIFTININLGVQLYIHFEAYPLLAYVGKKEFAKYLQEYEQRLVAPLIIPYVTTILSNIALLFARPEGLAIEGVGVLLVLNLAVSTVTMMLATPIYERIKKAGSAPAADMAQLMQINLIRLVLSAVSGVLVIYLVLDLLAK